MLNYVQYLFTKINQYNLKESYTSLIIKHLSIKNSMLKEFKAKKNDIGTFFKKYNNTV